jgi:hypothetical protein
MRGDEFGTLHDVFSSFYVKRYIDRERERERKQLLTVVDIDVSRYLWDAVLM